MYLQMCCTAIENVKMIYAQCHIGMKLYWQNVFIFGLFWI